MAYVVSLKQFDGPLDLLLTLISRAKIDICDIFVSEITEQYLEQMQGVDELDMDSASEFLQMAATLLEIKSRALLPTPPKEPEEGEETPEQALIRQLTEYRAYKELSHDLQALEEAAKRMLSKLPEEYPLPPPEFELTGLSMEGLSRALMRILSRLERDEQPAEPRRIRRDSYTVQSCMQHIAQRLRQANGTALPFEDLLEEDPCRAEVVTLFMAMLEMLKLNRLAVRQDENFGEILLLPVRRQEYAR